MKRFQFVGLGQPIIDVLIRLRDDAELAPLRLTPGSWQRVEFDRWQEVLGCFSGRDRIVTPGDSVSNTLCFLGRYGRLNARMGVLYTGQSGHDVFGTHFRDHMGKHGCVHYLLKHARLPTARALSLVSPSGERTILTYMGASEALEEPGERFWEFFQQTRFAHFSAFTLAVNPVRRVTIKAIELARASDAHVSLDLAAPGLIRDQRDLLLRLVEWQQIDTLFANTVELQALAGDGLLVNRLIRKLLTWHPGLCLVLKAGPSGSLIITRNERVRIAAYPTRVVDTTGAGDAYAGAFLAGRAKGWSLRRSGIYGSRAASLAVSQMGATLNSATEIWRIEPINDEGDTLSDV